MRQILGLTKINVANTCNNRKSHCEGLVKEIIESIRIMLKDGLFRDEQHVRFSLIGRICQKLGWDIWNPAEFYTEYSVKKYPPQEVTTVLRGRIDVALFLTDKRSDKAEVFIEVKNPGKLRSELSAGETQLQRYNYWDKAAICILTDGITWRFYLPSEGGAFESTLFNEFNILHDRVDLICITLERVLRRDNFRKQALQTAGEMFEELGEIRLVNKVKEKAIQIAKDTGMDKFLIAQRLLKQNEQTDMDMKQIENIWDKTIPGGLEPPPPPPPPPDDLTGTKPVRVFIIDKWFDKNIVSDKFGWSDVKVITYKYILEKERTITLSGRKGIFTHMEDKRKQSTKSIGYGFLIDTGFNANTLVQHCREALRNAGFELDSMFVIEAVPQSIGANL